MELRGIFVDLLLPDFFSFAGSLSDSELEPSSESGKGVFCARELVEESESESESEPDEEDSPSDDELLLFTGDLDTFFVLLGLDFGFSASESELESSELVEDEESLLDTDLTGTATEAVVAVVLTFLAFGASSSELESAPEAEDPPLEDAALRFNALTLAFGDTALVTSVSFSSSASLSDALEEEDEDENEDDDGEAFRFVVLVTGA